MSTKPATPKHSAGGEKRKLTTAEKKQRKAERMVKNKKVLVTTIKGTDGSEIAYNVKDLKAFHDATTKDMTSEERAAFMSHLVNVKNISVEEHNGFPPTSRHDDDIPHALFLRYGKTHIVDDEKMHLTTSFKESLARAFEQNQDVTREPAVKECNDQEEDMVYNYNITHD